MPIPLLDPRQYAFWSKEEQLLLDKIAPTLLSLIFKGGTNGSDLLPERVRVLVDWDQFNQRAVDYLHNYRVSWWQSINEVTRNHTVQAIDEWIKNGEPLPMLEARLERYFDQPRAHRVAVTEVTRVYAEGNQAAWRSTGFVESQRWHTSNDEKVCPICAPLDGMEVELDGGEFTTEEGEGITGPPAHVNCRCWLTPVVSVEAAGKEFERILED